MIILGLSQIIHPSIIHSDIYNRETWPIFLFIFAILLPLVLLLVAKIRKINGNQGNNTKVIVVHRMKAIVITEMLHKVQVAIIIIILPRVIVAVIPEMLLKIKVIVITIILLKVAVATMAEILHTVKTAVITLTLLKVIVAAIVKILHRAKVITLQAILHKMIAIPAIHQTVIKIKIHQKTNSIKA